MENFKNIHIGNLVREKFFEEKISITRACNFHKVTEEELELMFSQKDLTTKEVLQWSKLLEYDFFRIYSQHLILFAPQKSSQQKKQKGLASSLPQFRKNIYSKEIIDFLIELFETKKKTREQIIEEYKISKTTLSRWIVKYKK